VVEHTNLRIVKIWDISALKIMTPSGAKMKLRFLPNSKCVSSVRLAASFTSETTDSISKNISFGIHTKIVGRI
jgi:hypothetical protein